MAALILIYMCIMGSWNSHITAVHRLQLVMLCKKVNENREVYITVCFTFYYFLILCKKLRWPYLDEAASNARAVLLSLSVYLKL